MIGMTTLTITSERGKPETSFVEIKEGIKFV